MRASRAYIAGLGTTGVMMCGVLALLVLVGAVVAFRGGAPEAIADRIEELLVDDRSTAQRPDRSAAADGDPAPGSLAPGPASAGPSASPSGGAGARRTGSSVGGGLETVAGTGGLPDFGGTPDAPAADQSGSSTGPAPVVPADVAGPVRSVTDGAGATVEGSGADLGETVANVDPMLGGTVGAGGGAVGGVVRSVGAMP